MNPLNDEQYKQNETACAEERERIAAKNDGRPAGIAGFSFLFVVIIDEKQKAGKHCKNRFTMTKQETAVYPVGNAAQCQQLKDYKSPFKWVLHLV